MTKLRAEIWCALATLHGETEEEKNRSTWNRFMCRRMSTPEKNRLKDQYNVPESEIESWDSECNRLAEEKLVKNLPHRNKNDILSEFVKMKRSRVVNISNIHMENAMNMDKFILKDIRLHDSIFLKEISFEGAIFIGSAKFSKVSFLGKINFGESVFTGESEFKEIKFANYANFKEAIFSESANFKNLIFEGLGNFVKSEFKSDAKFTKIDFRKKSNFSVANFRKNACFENIIFGGHVTFRLLYSVEDISFENIKFNRPAIFIGSRFYGDAIFADACFQSDAHFGLSFFYRKINFSQTAFGGFVSFYGTQFYEMIYFDQTKFGNNVNFKYAQFRRVIPVFFQSKLPADTIFTIDTKWRWPPPSEDRARGKNSYSYLRGVMRDHHKPDDEHFFYRQEMAWKLYHEKLPFHSWLAIKIYGWTSDYGHSLWRPLAGFLVTLLFPTILARPEILHACLEKFGIRWLFSDYGYLIGLSLTAVTGVVILSSIFNWLENPFRRLPRLVRKLPGIGKPLAKNISSSVRLLWSPGFFRRESPPSIWFKIARASVLPTLLVWLVNFLETDWPMKIWKLPDNEACPATEYSPLPTSEPIKWIIRTSAANMFPLFGFGRKYVFCKFEIEPWGWLMVSGLQSLLAIMFLFLFALALRNRFRLR